MLTHLISMWKITLVKNIINIINLYFKMLVRAKHLQENAFIHYFHPHVCVLMYLAYEKLPTYFGVLLGACAGTHYTWLVYVRTCTCLYIWMLTKMLHKTHVLYYACVKLDCITFNYAISDMGQVPVTWPPIGLFSV